MRRAALLAVLAALGVAGVASAAFTAGSETGTLDKVTATLRWDSGRDGPRHLRLTIARAGVTAFAGRVPDRLCPAGSCRVARRGDLHVVDLDRDGEPEVLVETDTGGAHCCSVLATYAYRGSTYRPLITDFRSTGFALRDVDRDGRTELAAYDVRFEDAFSSHAGSYPPPRVLRFDRGTGRPRMLDITRDFPGFVKAHATKTLKLLRRQRRGCECGGLMSAYVADEFLLRAGVAGLKEFDRARRRGLLGSARKAKAFRANLLGFLHETGYR